MQQSSMILFCDECGAANEPESTQCKACQKPLATSPALLPTPTQASPIRVAPPVVNEVVAGSTVIPQAPSRMPVDLLLGAVLFGRYQICREIGRGGFSIVYLAEDLHAGRKQVAIKRIYLRTLTPRQTIDATETCNREIKLLSALKGVPGVPQFYDSFTDPENWYLAMEYIQGQTLEEYMQKAPGGYLPENKVAEIGAELAYILQNLHSPARQVIFRDVKPANIMITPYNKLYLIDFGIARYFKPGQRRDTTPLGSPGYAPPEQYGRAQTDERSDIYSLGATLQTLLTGRDPLELAQGESSRNPHQTSSRMNKLLYQMLELEASKRPPTMKQVRRYLLWFKPNMWRAFLSFNVGVAVGTLLAGIVFLLNFLAHVWSFDSNVIPILSMLTFYTILILKIRPLRSQRFKKLGRYLYRYLHPDVALIGVVLGGILAALVWIVYGFLHPH